MNQKPFWIGLIDKSNDGNFTWESGLMLHSDVESFWAPGQPNNMVQDGRRVCTRVHTQSKMDDINCGSTNNHVLCQKNIEGNIDLVMGMITTCWSIFSGSRRKRGVEQHAGKGKSQSTSIHVQQLAKRLIIRCLMHIYH